DAGFDKDSQHRAFKAGLPGRIDLWPLVEKVDDRVDQHWSEPLDRPSPRSHTVVLAERIAGQIRKMIDGKETIPDERNGVYFRRPVRAGDFLILVQRRSDLFGEIIRACKKAELPIAGADRLKIGAELAVRDLAALLRFLSTPEDDLSLACVLKSPLFGWCEQDLFTLAHARGAQYLWKALRKAEKSHPETIATLVDMRDAADFLRPYDLIERMLIRHNGRKRLLGRLGVEAEDGINALLGQALAYERTEIPSLTGFLTWMETDDLEIKRQMSTAGDMIRVMTVHGAKGLESPIVILPDTAKRQMMDRSTIVTANDVPFWKPRSDDMPGALAETRDAARAREMQERQRLLYVALTRAEKWLIVAAAGDLDKDGNSWYQQVAEAMKADNAMSFDIFDGTGLTIEDADWRNLPVEEPVAVAEASVGLPALYSRRAPQPAPPREVLSPSELGGAKALAGAAGEDEDTAKRRGTLVHLLLENLPAHDPGDWDAVAFGILKDADKAEAQGLLAEAKGVLDTPALAHLFADTCLTEAPLTAEIGGQRLHGVIDRLLIEDKRVLAVDFKSNAIVPATPQDCPDGLLRQMGAYALQLKQIYPDKDIETAILWTKTAKLMHLPYAIVIEALNHAPHLDLADRHT
ncbi:MAG: 3'-5' exonuclease, partial [Arenibacterium sp.]